MIMPNGADIDNNERDVIATINMTSRAIHYYCATRMHSADYAVARCPSVCPSVTCGSESKQLYISSKFFHHRLAPPF